MKNHKLTKLETNGIPVEVFVSTEERTAFSYFAKPITDQFANLDLRQRSVT